jgi:hypothetical protein
MTAGGGVGERPWPGGGKVPVIVGRAGPAPGRSARMGHVQRRLRALAVTLSLLTALIGSVATAGAAGATVDPSDVLPVGAAPDAGSLRSLGIRPAERVLGIAPSATGAGYWMVASDGGIFAFGDAPFFGSMGGQRLNRPMIGMAATASGLGYWMFAGDGGIFAYGDAPFFGSLGSEPLNAPVVAMAPTASGLGYWMLGADGGVFAFGDAPFLGSTGSNPPAAPVVAMVPSRAAPGYWLLTSAGQVITFGAATHHGDLVDKKLSNPVVGMAATTTGAGYWLVQQDGQVWAFGDATASGLAAGARCLGQPVVGVAARPQGDGLWLATAPRAAVVTAGLHPLDQLEREHADLVLRIRLAQGCQTARTPGGFSAPLAGARLTSPYGPRIHPVHQRPQFHRGIDLAGVNTTIRAAAAGTVLEVSTRVGYGRTVVLDHGGRLSTVYSHLASVAVREGQTVRSGDVLGVVGATGFATGPHLHVEVRVSGEVVDPTDLLPGWIR